MTRRGIYAAGLALLVALIEASVGAAQTGDLAGQVTLSVSPTPPPPARRGIYRSAPPAGRHPAESRLEQLKHVVIYLSGSGLPTVSPPRAHSVLQQRGVTFIPHILPIVKGTTVDFPNLDNIYHNVFSYSETKRFDLGRYPEGESRSVTFETPGVVRLFCEIHAHMSAIILVLDKPHFVLADDGEPFHLSGVPAGTHEMTVWHEHLGTQSRSVTIQAGDTTRVDVTL